MFGMKTSFKFVMLRAQPKLLVSFTLGVASASCGQNSAFTTQGYPTAADEAQSNKTNEASRSSSQRPLDSSNANDGGQSNEPEVAEVLPSAVPDIPPSQPRDRVITTTQTLSNDSFLLAGNLETRDEFLIPVQPFQTELFEQVLDTPKQRATTVLGITPEKTSVTLTGPLSNPVQQHKMSWEGKPVDVYIVIDDSESFARNEVLVGRTRNAIKKLIANLNGMNWQLFMSGLPGNATDDSTTIRPDTPNATIDQQIDRILTASALGDEQTMQGLAKLLQSRKAVDRDDAVHAFLVISDAPNCKNNNNQDSETCKTAPGNIDNHRYIFDKLDTALPLYMRHMSLFGAYYRMFENPSVCSTLDKVETPAPGTALALKSQYADLALFWEKFLFPAANSVAPSWVGDICAPTENSAFIGSFTQAIKNLSKHRIAIGSAYDSFLADPGFNFSISSGSVPLIPTSYFVSDETGKASPTGRMVQTQEGTRPDNELLTITSNVSNNYRKLLFSNVFPNGTLPGSVRVIVPEGELSCPEGPAFAGNLANAPCRVAGKDLVFRNYDDLPKLQPAAPARTQNLTVNYSKPYQTVSSISVATEGAPILLDRLQVLASPPGASNKIPAYTVSTGPTSITINFVSPLSEGTYVVSYFDASQQKLSVNLKSEADRIKSQPKCFLPDQVASAEATGIVLGSGQWLPCSLNSNNKTIELNTVIPLNKATGKRDFKVAYFGFVAPESRFSLTSPPSKNTLIVRWFAENDKQGIVLGSKDFVFDSSRITLAKALQPGERLTADYQYLPDLGDGCFVLSGRASSGKGYAVYYGLKLPSKSLESDLFMISKVSDTQDKICLAAEILTHGALLSVAYLSNIATTETEK